ncbi:MAG: SDR family NAD(P)-dependent oxidoreductase [Dehalococcoidales bacterium]|nr:SDR family NAD(P)-dependent oxidoreductase [Dehalococcoidales bacterium]
MELGFKDKVALITGTGSQTGIGKAVALTLAREGCHIISCDIDLAGAEKTAAEVRALNRNAVAFKVDITDRNQVNDMVKNTLQQFSRIDIFAGIAGGSSFTGPLVDAKWEAIDREINLNLTGTINCTKAVLPGMVENKYGKIIFISSNSAFVGIPGGSSYSSAKAGVMAFTRSIAREAGPSGVNVNNISPGLVIATNFYGGEGAPMLPPDVRKSGENSLKRMITPQDIANVFTFLASDAASSITGQCIVVDGGQVMD